MGQIIFKHQSEFWIRMQQQNITKDQLKAQIAAKNLAIKERAKKMTFEDALEEDIKAIKEEEASSMDAPKRRPRTQFAKKPKPAPETDDKKLIE